MGQPGGRIFTLVCALATAGACDKDAARPHSPTEPPPVPPAAHHDAAPEIAETPPAPDAAPAAARPEPVPDPTVAQEWRFVWQSPGDTFTPLTWPVGKVTFAATHAGTDDEGRALLHVTADGTRVETCAVHADAKRAAIDARAEDDTVVHVRCRSYARGEFTGWSSGARLRWNPKRRRFKLDGGWESEGDAGDPDTMDFDE